MAVANYAEVQERIKLEAGAGRVKQGGAGAETPGRAPPAAHKDE